jgi:hypothetical protein
LPSYRKLSPGARRALLVAAFIALLSVAAMTVYVSLPDGPGDDSPLANAHYDKERFPRIRSPLVGVNYTHYDFPGCQFPGRPPGLSDTGILTNYHEPGVRNKVHRQLYEMRKNGVSSIRTVIWHMTDPGQQRWGPVPSAGGTLVEPYRSNLVNYVREVRRFGFARLTIPFGPRASNDPRNPRAPGQVSYDPAKFEENWRFIQDVRSLVKRHGPRWTRFDILAEGAVSSHAPRSRFTRVRNYVREMYTRYVRQFGKGDVTVSVIPARYSTDRGNRLQNLISVLESTGMGQPRWYDLHIGYTAVEADHSLRNSDAVLRRNRLSQPIVVGETAYNDRRIARVIRKFRGDGGRRVQEVISWYVRWTKKCNVSPPYRVTAFKRELLRRGRR